MTQTRAQLPTEPTDEPADAKPTCSTNLANAISSNLGEFRHLDEFRHRGEKGVAPAAAEKREGPAAAAAEKGEGRAAATAEKGEAAAPAAAEKREGPP